MQLCQRYFISGRVQGVFFRASTEEVANKIGVKGWVRNTFDGKVEIVACGEPSQLEALESWLKIGPEYAEVKNVVVEETDFETFIHFECVPTG